MKKEELVRAFEDLKVQCLKVFRDMMAAAPNLKTGEHTLDASSNIYRDTKAEVEEMNMVNIIIPYYIQYIDGIDPDGKHWYWARRPGFVEAIELWMRKRGIPTTNGGLWRMINGIKKNGIKSRPVFAGWEQEVDKLMEKWLDELFDAIVSDLDAYFNE